MPIDPRTPVIVGVGQVCQRSSSIDDALEPVALIAEAARAAEADAEAKVLSAVQSVRVVSLLSWRYRDPGALVAAEIGAQPAETIYTTAGGNTPQMLMNVTALDIQAGRADCVLLCGGETWRTRMRARKADVTLDWTKQDDSVAPSRMLGSELTMSHPHEASLGLVMPVQLYPMFESAFRAGRGEAPDAHIERVSCLWARFSEVAAGNPYAWVQEARTPEEIRTPGPQNRMIGWPYPKYMNSNNDVDQAAAILVCSVEQARRLGIPEDRWVFPLAGTDTHDHYHVSNRADLKSSPAIRIGGRRALELAGVGVDDLAMVDLYSCFPSAVQIAATELGLGFDRDLTVTGGLCFAGGPWNNYVMHAIATTITALRARPGERGLVTANGGYVTKHAFGVYSTTPPEGGFRHDAPQRDVDALPRRELAEGWEGPATIEAYTVMHDRDGNPETGFAAVLLADGRRAWAVARDRHLAAAMTDGEWVGLAVTIGAENALVA